MAARVSIRADPDPDAVFPFRSDEAAITGAASGVEQTASIAFIPNTLL